VAGVQEFIAVHLIT